MNINYKLLLFVLIPVIVLSFLTLFISHEYQFCIGSCTGNLSNCWCAIISASPSFGVLLVVLIGSIYYYLKEKPSFFTLLAVIVILFVGTLLAIFLLLLLASMLMRLH